MGYNSHKLKQRASACPSFSSRESVFIILLNKQTTCTHTTIKSPATNYKQTTFNYSFHNRRHVDIVEGQLKIRSHCYSVQFSYYWHVCLICQWSVSGKKWSVSGKTSFLSYQPLTCNEDPTRFISSYRVKNSHG